MAYGLIGNTPSDRPAGTNSGWTYMDLNVVAPARGILKSFTIYVATNVVGLKIKIFRDDGTNYVFIGETVAQNLDAGLHSDLPCWIPVERGDLIALYHTEGSIDWTATGGTAKYYTLGGDVVTTTLKTAWSNTTVIMSLQGRIFTRVAPL